MQKTLNIPPKLNLKNALALLKLTIGIPQENDIETSESVHDLVQKSTKLTTDFSVQNNLNHILLSKSMKLDEFNLKNKKAMYLPTANLFFQQTYNAFRNEFNLFSNNEKWFPQTFWGLQVNIPVFSSGSRWAQIQQAKITVEKDKFAISELERTLKFQEVQARNNLSNSLERLQLQENNIELAKNIYENEITKEQIGKGNSILVTQKYNQLLMAQAEFVGALAEVFNARLNLDLLHNNLITK
jgi:outer membrane protein